MFTKCVIPQCTCNLLGRGINIYDSKWYVKNEGGGRRRWKRLFMIQCFERYRNETWWWYVRVESPKHRRTYERFQLTTSCYKRWQDWKRYDSTQDCTVYRIQSEKYNSRIGTNGSNGKYRNLLLRGFRVTTWNGDLLM